MIHLNLLLRNYQMKNELSLMKLVIKKLICEKDDTVRKSIMIVDEMRK